MAWKMFIAVVGDACEYTGHTQKNGVVAKANKLYFSSYMGTTYTVSSGNCPSFSCVDYNPSMCVP
jgi:hypothetical protein